MAHIIILISSIIFIGGLANANSACGDWTSYRDEKCFKVFHTLTPFSGAAQVCQKEGATIGIIRSAEEQGLVLFNLKNQSIVDNVWIGVKRNGKSFVSLDGNVLEYTLWANNRPLNQTDIDCVEISEENENKWVDTKCDKNNAVLCQKPQQWSNSTIEEVLQQIRNIQDSQRKELDQLKQNPVPIGFIYIQLSGQSEPHTLWPQTEWNNISPKYAGLFFRAEGSGAAGFGTTQNEQARSLLLNRGDCGGYPNGCYLDQFRDNPISVTTNFHDKPFYTGDWSDEGDHNGMNFKYTTDENRPRNQAIRIWIRIK